MLTRVVTIKKSPILTSIWDGGFLCYNAIVIQSIFKVRRQNYANLLILAKLAKINLDTPLCLAFSISVFLSLTSSQTSTAPNLLILAKLAKINLDTPLCLAFSISVFLSLTSSQTSTAPNLLILAKLAKINKFHVAFLDECVMECVSSSEIVP